jgi:hypothetical protein
MAEQIPEAWVGQEVIVYFGAGHRQAGTLRDWSGDVETGRRPWWRRIFGG